MSLRRALVWQGGQPVLMGGTSISEDRERNLQTKSIYLQQKLVLLPSERPQIAAEVARILSSGPIQETGSEVDGTLQAVDYLEVALRFPLWVVAEFGRRMRAGLTPYGRPWGPKPVQLGDELEKVVQPHRNDLMTLQGLLMIAKAVPSEETHQLIADGLDDLKASLGGKPTGPLAQRDERSWDEQAEQIRQGAAQRLANYPRVKPKAPPIEGAEG